MESDEKIEIIKKLIEEYEKLNPMKPKKVEENIVYERLKEAWVDRQYKLKYEKNV